jgi:hypothetical protein
VQRLELHLAAPARQRGDSSFEIGRHHPVRKRGFGAVAGREGDFANPGPSRSGVT